MSYKFEYETQGAATFLVYRKEAQDVVDSMAMGMISNNKIEGVLPFIYVQIDQDTFFKYNVSSQNTLKQYFSGVVTKTRFLKVIESLLDSFILAEEYMLETSSVVLDSSYIFVNPNTSEASVVVLPIVNETENSVENFMRTLVFSTQFDQSEDCSYIAALINFLNSNQFFSIHKFKELVQDLLQEKTKTQTVRNEYKKVETAIPRAVDNSPKAFAEVEKVIPNVQISQKVENGQQYVETAITYPVMPEIKTPPAMESPVNESPKETKKEKRSLFGKKEKVAKPAKRAMPEPPPFSGAIPGSGAVKTPPAPATPPVPVAAPVQKEKKSLFGKKESPKKKTNKMAIPGMPMPNSKAATQSPEIPDVKQPNEIQKQTVIPTQQVQLQKHAVQMQDFGATVDLRTFSEGTTVLTAGTTVLVNPVQEKKFFVKRVQTREMFEVKKTVSKIGKDAMRNEICIQGNSAISREHAVFYCEGEQIFIEDVKSTNGTYVNGIRLQPGIRSNPLSNGETVRLGDEELEIIVQN